MSDKKLIVFDLDETLLDDKRQITDLTLAVLKKLHNDGHKLIINTARSAPFQKEIFDEIGADYSIVCGGAIILNEKGETIYEMAVDNSTASAFIEELRHIADDIAAEIGGFCYCTSPSKYRPNDKLYDFSAGLPEGNVPKMLASSHKNEAMAGLVKKYGLCETLYHNGYWRRIGHPLASKEEGLRALLAILGEDMQNVIAFGDDYGDVGMIREAGIGVLMKNADESLYPLCPCISERTNCEDGVAAFLIKYFGLNI